MKLLDFGGVILGGGFDVRAEESAEKVLRQNKSVPQRLKPRCKCGTYGTGKPVPLTKPSFSAPSEVRAYRNGLASIDGSAIAGFKAKAKAKARG